MLKIAETALHTNKEKLTQMQLQKQQTLLLLDQKKCINLVNSLNILLTQEVFATFHDFTFYLNWPVGNASVVERWMIMSREKILFMDSMV